MKKLSKIKLTLITSLLLLISVLILGYGNHRYQVKELEELVVDCNGGNDGGARENNPIQGNMTQEEFFDNGFTPLNQAKIVCDPLILIELEDLVGVQNNIVETYSRIQPNYYMENRTIIIAIIMATLFIPFLLIFAVPWIWYFLLGRLRELSLAIQGNNDSK